MTNPLGAGSRPEIDLLLSCSRATIDSKHAQRIKELSQNNIDWNHLLSLAGRHGLMPLLFHHLNSICPEGVPGPILGRLENHFNANLGYNRFLTGELLKLLILFEDHGIPAVPFKGPVLASSIYGDLSLRQFSDLDVLINKQEFNKVKGLLLSHGYVPIYRLNNPQEAASIRLGCQFHFRQEKTGVDLEIFWEFGPKELSFPVNLHHLWKHLERVSFFGKEIFAFSPEDLLHILCFHGYKHGWEGLGWICDVAGLIRIHDRMDWDLVLEEAHRLGSERILFLGLYLGKNLLEVTLPGKVCQQIKSDTKIEMLAQKIYKHLFKGTQGSPGILEKSFFHLRSIKTFRKRFQYCYYLTIPPSFVEFESLKLSPSLFFLYYLFRPFRLLGKYSVGRLINSLLASEVSVTKEKVYDKSQPEYDPPAYPRSQDPHRFKQQNPDFCGWEDF